MQQCSEEKVGASMLHGNPLERRDKAVCLGGTPVPQPSSLPLTVGRTSWSKNLPCPDRHVDVWLTWKYQVEDRQRSQGRDGKK